MMYYINDNFLLVISINHHCISGWYHRDLFHLTSWPHRHGNAPSGSQHQGGYQDRGELWIMRQQLGLAQKMYTYFFKLYESTGYFTLLLSMIKGSPFGLFAPSLFMNRSEFILNLLMF